MGIDEVTVTIWLFYIFNDIMHFKQNFLEIEEYEKSY